MQNGIPKESALLFIMAIQLESEIQFINLEIALNEGGGSELVNGKVKNVKWNGGGKSIWVQMHKIREVMTR